MSFTLPPWARAIASPVPAPWPEFGLGPRLAALAQAVPKAARIADIGTDHALLPEALLRTARVERAIGSDRALAPIEAARKRLEARPPAVELRVGSGFGPYRPREIDTAVLAGFGARKIVEVLECADLETLGVRHLVLQPTAGLPGLRRYLGERGFQFGQDTIVREGGRGFITIHGTFGGLSKRELTPMETLLGTVPLDHPLLPAWLESQLAHLSRQGLRAEKLHREVADWLKRHGRSPSEVSVLPTRSIGGIDKTS